VWILVGGFWGNNIGIHEADWTKDSLATCYRIRPDDWAGCDREFEKNFNEAIQYHWYYAAFFAFVPIPIAWLIVYGFIWLTRWISRGFKPST
jgi:hypothetical protein